MEERITSQKSATSKAKYAMCGHKGHKSTVCKKEKYCKPEIMTIDSKKESMYHKKGNILKLDWMAGK